MYEARRSGKFVMGIHAIQVDVVLVGLLQEGGPHGSPQWEPSERHQEGVRQDPQLIIPSVGHGQAPRHGLERQGVARRLPRGQDQEHGSRWRIMTNK